MGKTINVGVAFGRALRKLRLASGLTQEQLGFESGLRRTFISSLELGEKQPTLETIGKLSAAFNMNMSKFMTHVEAQLKSGK